jgi:hypothetical protein
MWEVERYDWSRLRAMGSASEVPEAISALRRATSAQEAERAYWRIDNVVVVQGALFEAAIPTTTCVVSALYQCSEAARPLMLELLVQLGSGEPDPGEIMAGNGGIQKLCARELGRGASIYLDLLENGSNEERGWCVDLVGICVRADLSLRERGEWYLKRLLSTQPEGALRQLVENWLREIAPEGA